MKRVFVLSHSMARANCEKAVHDAPEGYKVTIQEPSRSLDQNAALWPILEAFADQLMWPINGVMTKLLAEDWKDLLTAAFRGENVRVCPSLSGSGMVMLGMRTSKMSKREFSDFLEFLHHVAADRGVVVYPEQVAA